MEDTRDCLGRDLFEGRDPEAPAVPADVAANAPRSMRGFLHEHRRPLSALATAVVLGAFVLVVLPQITGLGDTLTRLREGDKVWLGVAVVTEALSIAGYATVFRAIVSCAEARIGWRESAQITLSGIVATKLFSAAGAGGVALTVWALRAAGMSGRTVAERMAALEVVLYAVYMGALALVGGAMALGVLPGPAPFVLTALPAIFGAAVIALALAMCILPADLERRLAGGPGARWGRLRARLAPIPATVRHGIVTAASALAHPRLGLLGAVAYWGFDITTLGLAFHAFGGTPAVPILIMGYFVGTLGNTLPIPGGVGGVEGGLIACFIAFGVSGSHAVVAVLAYRLISYWLPILPGAVEYFRLRTTVASWRASRRAEALTA